MLSMAASKFEDLDNNNGNIQSYFRNNNSSSLKYSNYESDKNIASISNRKQISKIEEYNSDKNVKDIDSHYIHETERKQNSITSVESSLCDDTINEDILNEKEETASSLEENSNYSPEKQDMHPGKAHDKSLVGFFAKKFSEYSEFSADVKFETSDKSALPSTSSEKDTFFSSIAKEKDNVSNLYPELTKLCDKCNKYIPVWEEIEHMDYHFAVDLSNEFKKQSVVQSVLNKSSAISKTKQNSNKRGHTSKSLTQAKKACVQSNTLDSFIKQRGQN